MARNQIRVDSPAFAVDLNCYVVNTYLLATRNRHKVAEIQAVLGAAFVCRSLDDFPPAPAVIEDAPTFAANAVKKASTLAEWLGCLSESFGAPDLPGWVLADDSGLEVDALDGAPGVHSARFAALDSGRPGNSTDAENNAKLLRLLEGVPLARRTARFRCAIALVPVVRRSPVAPDGAGTTQPQSAGAALVFEGTCEGRILGESRGARGFGYDPLFEPEGFASTFAELGEATKNRISHRARALAAVLAHLRAAGHAG
jgi:XTP/dITP diphosphohydrolase